MSQEVLVGLWSAEHRSNPGSMSDALIAFLANGGGFFEFCNPGVSHVETFRWKLDGEGTLSVTGIASYYRERERAVEEEPGQLHFEKLPYRVESEHTPGGKTMEVLTLGDERCDWRESLFEAYGVVTDKFALLRRAVEDDRSWWKPYL